MAKLILHAAIVALAVAAPTAEHQTQAMNIGLTQRRSFTNADGTVDLDMVTLEANRVLAKYNHGGQTLGHDKHRLSARDIGSVSLTPSISTGDLRGEELETHYTADVQIGSQTLPMLIDTGSISFVVPGPDCANCSGTRYDQQGQPQGFDVTDTYAIGTIVGAAYLDTVAIGDLSAPNTQVLSVFNTTFPFSVGIMGLRPQALSTENHFLRNLELQGKLSAPEFSLYLGREKSNTADRSELTIGGCNPTKYNGAPFKIPKLAGYTSWAAALDDVYVGDEPIAGSQAVAIFDSGTPAVIVPKPVLLSMASQIQGARFITETGVDLLAIPCSAYPEVSFGFSGDKFAMNLLDLVFGGLSQQQAQAFGLDNSINYCVATVFGSDLDGVGAQYIMGSPFLKNWYSIFSFADGGSVSLAPAVGNQ